MIPRAAERLAVVTAVARDAGRSDMPVARRGGCSVNTSPLEERALRTGAGEAVVIGPLALTEHDALFALFDDVVAGGAGFPHPPPFATRRLRAPSAPPAP